MSRFFAKNLQASGRIIRGVIGLFMFTGGLFTLGVNVWVGIGLIVSSAFVLFEAVRGWCVVRACGIKTRY